MLQQLHDDLYQHVYHFSFLHQLDAFGVAHDARHVFAHPVSAHPVFELLITPI